MGDPYAVDGILAPVRVGQFPVVSVRIKEVSQIQARVGNTRCLLCDGAAVRGSCGQHRIEGVVAGDRAAQDDTGTVLCPRIAHAPAGLAGVGLEGLLLDEEQRKTGELDRYDLFFDGELRQAEHVFVEHLRGVEVSHGQADNGTDNGKGIHGALIHG